MEKVIAQKLAEFLHGAEVGKKAVPRITLEHESLSVEDGYEIQEELIDLKRKLGHHIVGAKMGLTSIAKMKQMNVNDPIYGYLFDYMVVPDGGVISMSELIHPKVEAEIAFILDKDLEGPGVTAFQVLESTKCVFPALEIIDSRYENFEFTLPDVIADNTSSSRVVFGNRIRNPWDLELDLVGVTLSIDHAIKAMGTGAAVLGHPANSVALFANMLAKRGKKIKAGEVILTGGITAAVLLSAGNYVSARLGGFGEVSFSVKA